MSDRDESVAAARRMRGEVIRLSNAKRVPHLGSSLSAVDILAVAYWSVLSIDPARPNDSNRDRLVLSKGHAASALYVALAERGFYRRSVLEELNTEGGRLQEHPGPGCVPGVEAATGSLGHGLPIAAGMALAARQLGKTYRAVAVMSDGECNEGAVWEAAQFAAAQRLSNLVAVIDFNKWQATGRSQEILALDPLREKWAAFGWRALEVDGHDHEELAAAMAPSDNPRPTAVVAHTVKGKGVSFMEDDNNWHYRIPTEQEVAASYRELGLESAEI
jgi:transketolase